MLLVALIVPVLASTSEGASAPERPALPGIYGEDDRRVIEDNGPPWTAIGRVNRNVGGFCTGTLIASDRVLTAAHCLWNRRTGKFLPADGLHFLAGYRQGAYLANRSIKSIRLAPGIALDERGRPREPAIDWAVLTLSNPLPSSARLMPIAPATSADIAALADGQPLRRAGYSQDRPHMPTAVSCKLLGRTGSNLLRHDCDGTWGDSGSPLLIETAAGWRVLGLHVAVAERGAESFGIATLVPDFLR